MANRLTGISIIAWTDMVERFPQRYFEWMKSWNMNSVQINFGWNYVEPTKGVYDEEYLSSLDTIINRARQAGLRVILRLHKWSDPWAYEASQGSDWTLGFPAWLTATPDFWENVEGCQERFVEVWRMLARRYRSNPYVVGFSLMGEPGNDIGIVYGDPATGYQNYYTEDSNACRKSSSVMFEPTKLWERAINAIREVSAKTVFIEGHAGLHWYIYMVPGDVESRVLVAKPNSTNFVCCQSFYSWFQFEWLDEILELLSSWKVPYFISEFGVPVVDIINPAPEKVEWVENACMGFEERGLGWSYWGFGPCLNDYCLVDERDESVSPIATDVLSRYGVPFVVGEDLRFLLVLLGLLLLTPLLFVITTRRS